MLREIQLAERLDDQFSITEVANEYIKGSHEWINVPNLNEKIFTEYLRACLIDQGSWALPVRS